MHAVGRLLSRSLLVLLGCATGGNVVLAQVNVLAERYDDARTGANLAETQLDSSNVNPAGFGKLWSYAVDGAIQAQPLYVHGVSIPGSGTRNVLYIVTMNDVAYAFDADSAATLWVRDLRSPGAGISAVPIVDITHNFNSLNIVGSVGIESTPVIDIASSTLYLVARTKENGGYFQRLHALDIATGAEKDHSPATIEGSVSGTGSGGDTVTFDPKAGNQRASLALANGQVYIAWASHEDLDPWHGWVMSYDKTTLAQTAILCDTPNGTDGGIWMGGRAPAVDANGSVYFLTGNGDWDGVSNFGESFVKLGPPNAQQLPVLSYFTPDNWAVLSGAPDIDLGSSGPLLVPRTNLVVGGGKESLLYLTSTANLGGLAPGNTQIVQTITVNPPDPPDYLDDTFILSGGPVYWDRTTGPGPWLYVWADNDYLKAYHFNGAMFDPNPVSLSTDGSAAHGGGVMTLSANGSVPGSGIVWASMPVDDDGDHDRVHGWLRAFDAGNLGHELWNSEIDHDHDNEGLWPKFSSPVVANGRVYMASFSGYVSVYGLLPTQPYFTLMASPQVRAANPGGSPVYAVTANAGAGFSGSVTLSLGNALPPGTTASWSSTSINAGDTATLTLTTSAVTPFGSYALTIDGSDGSQTRTAGIALVVRPARSIGLEFWGPDCTPGGMDTMEVAGVVARAYWNNSEYAVVPNPDRPTPALLNDDTGAPTEASASWSASANSATPVSDVPGDYRLMRCYLDPAVASSASVTISDLPANDSGYDIYVYADGDNGGSASTGMYEISGTDMPNASLTITDAANTDFSGAYVRAADSVGNYAQFAIRGTGFTLTATPANSGAPINGIQIVPDRLFANGFD